MLSLAGKQWDQGSSISRSKQRKKTPSSTSFSATHRQMTDKETKEDFYKTLQENYMTILMGDLKAKIGSDNSGYEEVRDRQGLGKTNENREILADLCVFNNMIIAGSVFPHRRIHKVTWVGPDHRQENQIKHICIGRTFRRSMQDVKV